MSERDGYQPGVPCWVDTWQPDPEAAVGFYTQLFGWQAEDKMPPDSPGHYFMCKRSGRVYPNFPDPGLEDWAHAYYGTNYDRLVRVKKRYDPNDFFHFQHSLPRHLPGRDAPAT